MKKIELIAMLTDSKKIIELLQRRGVVEISRNDDEELEKIRQDCLNGTLRCGDCKVRTAELMEEFMEDLKEKQIEAREIAKTLI